MKIDFNSFTRKERYQFFISFIIPRPIALITTINDEKLVNAAPFSYFSGISTTPPLFMVSITSKKTGEKDTYNNIVHKKEFVVNMVTDEMVHGVSISAVDFPSDISEMDYNNFHYSDSELVEPPGIKESPVRMEMQLVRVIDDLIPDQNFHLIIGEAKVVHIHDDYYIKENKQFNYKKSQIIARLGNNDYMLPGEIIMDTIPDFKDIFSQFNL